MDAEKIEEMFAALAERIAMLEREIAAYKAGGPARAERFSKIDARLHQLELKTGLRGGGKNADV